MLLFKEIKIRKGAYRPWTQAYWLSTWQHYQSSSLPKGARGRPPHTTSFFPPTPNSLSLLPSLCLCLQSHCPAWWAEAFAELDPPAASIKNPRRSAACVVPRAWTPLPTWPNPSPSPVFATSLPLPSSAALAVNPRAFFKAEREKVRCGGMPVLPSWFVEWCLWRSGLVPDSLSEKGVSPERPGPTHSPVLQNWTVIVPNPYHPHPNPPNLTPLHGRSKTGIGFVELLPTIMDATQGPALWLQYVQNATDKELWPSCWLCFSPQNVIDVKRFFFSFSLGLSLWSTCSFAK